MKDFNEQKKNIILFSYQSAPVLAAKGAEGGFSVTVYGDGEVRHCVYNDSDEIELLEVYHLNRKALKIFLSKIEKAEKRLENVPENLDNGSEGGVFQEFVFSDRKAVSSKNIKKASIRQAFVFEHKNYKKYRENMKNENLLMEIFEEISRELDKSGIKLDLRGCKAKKSCKLRVSWCELEKKASRRQNAELNCL